MALSVAYLLLALYTTSFTTFAHAGGIKLTLQLVDNHHSTLYPFWLQTNYFEGIFIYFELLVISTKTVPTVPLSLPILSHQPIKKKKKKT